MAVNGIEIAVGQRWRTRAGEMVEIVEQDPTDTWRWFTNTSRWLTDAGRYSDTSDTPYDLVALAFLAEHLGTTETLVYPQSMTAEHAGMDETLDATALPEIHESLLERRQLQEPGAPRRRADDAASTALDVQVAGDHYKKLVIQPIEYIHANGIGFAEGSVIKYVTRWRDKGGIKDLEKAKHFIDLLIELESKKEAK